TVEQVRTMAETGLITPDTMSKPAEEWRALVSAISGTWQRAQRFGRWFLRLRGEQLGPFIFDQLRSMWQQGQLPPDTRCKLAELWQPLARGLPSWTAQPLPT